MEDYTIKRTLGGICLIGGVHVKLYLSFLSVQISVQIVLVDIVDNICCGLYTHH